MAIAYLELHDFTVFRQATFKFASGINVFIGENATGKSHLLKLLYAVEVAMWEQQRSGRQTQMVKFAPFEAHLLELFRVKSLKVLVGPKRGVSQVSIGWAPGGSASFMLGAIENVASGVPYKIGVPLRRPVFIPTREMLSIFPGFEETIRNRELEFDETYAHLAEALNLPPLKGDALKKAGVLLELVESALGGTESQKEGRFYVKLGRGTFEAHLVAEGLRKVATLARLIRNGRIARGVVLFWDEPESNLNPVLMRKVVNVLLALAKAGVQVFLASHDYLLTQTLSLEAEHPRADTPPMQFFGLARGKDGSVAVEQADTIAGIDHNPILQEHARQYGLEIEAEERAAKVKRGRR